MTDFWVGVIVGICVGIAVCCVYAAWRCNDCMDKMARALREAEPKIDLPRICPDCGSDDIEYGRTAKKARLIAHCRACKGWFGPHPKIDLTREKVYKWIEKHGKRRTE